MITNIITNKAINVDPKQDTLGNKQLNASADKPFNNNKKWDTFASKNWILPLSYQW